ncbi:recombinase family protein [Ralstonia sp. R-29]|uniref:recombinase family protein n=1 Tax=Ralstonia sp. R-29 TaxID=3404059 RepID=UPI003CF29ADE
MKGQRVGYVRVSTLEQNTDRQLEGIELDRCFTDRASGKDVARPELIALKRFVREGDIVVVHSMDRLARNLDDLRQTVKELTARGVCIEFVKEGLKFTGEDSPMAQLMLSVMGAFAEFERALLRERQREGITLAKQRGVYRGRKPSLDAQGVAELMRRVAEGERKSDIARDLGICRETLYCYLRKPSPKATRSSAAAPAK